MKIKHTEFGKTKLVRAVPHNMQPHETPDHVLWVERGEDLYALESKDLKGKKVAIVHRVDWARAQEIKPSKGAGE